MIPRFVLRHIAAVNFYLYAQDFPLSGYGNTVFLGSNGSGKSMLLDAIQIVMTGMNRRFLDLNSRVSEGGRNTRTVREACLGLLDDGQGYERKECLTYITLGFESEDGSRKCTAGVCLEAKESVSEETVLGLFVVDDAVVKFDDLVHKQAVGFEEKKWHTFLDEQRRLGRKVEVYARQNNKSFLRQLYAIINANQRGTQLEPDRARAALQQALSFDISKITSVTEFVRKFLLDEATIDIDTFQARYTTWRDMQREIVRVEAEIEEVDTIRTLANRVMDEQFNSRMWAYAESRAEYDRFSAEITKQRAQISDMQELLDSTQSYQLRLTDSIEYTRERLEGLRRQIDGSPAHEQLRRAQAEKEHSEATRRAAQTEAKYVFNALKALREAALSPALPKGNAGIVTFAQIRLTSEAIGTYNADWPVSARHLHEILSAIPALSTTREQVDAQYQSALAEKARLADAAGEIERQLRNLQTGGSIMSRDTQDFLADMARMGIVAHSLSELADIVPALAEWRGIVEAILGDWGEAVVVDPQSMDRAFAHFEANYKGLRTKLVQSEAVTEKEQAVQTGTLAEAVVTGNRYARAFLNVRLGRIHRARSAQEIRRNDLAASCDGKYAHGRGIEYRRLPTVPKLGKSVRDQQIAQFTQQLQEIQPRLQRAKDAEVRASGLVEALRLAEAGLIQDKSRALGLLETIATAEAQAATQADLIADLQADLPEGLLAEIQAVEADLKAYRQEERDKKAKERTLIDQIGQRTAGLNANAEQRTKAGRAALAAVPDRKSRARNHEPPLGLECFVQRAHAAYRRQCANHAHLAEVRNYFENLKRRSPRGNATRLIGAIQDYVQKNPDLHPGFEWALLIETERTSTVFDWAARRHQLLIESILRGFKVQVDAAVLALVETMVHDFLSRLKNNVETVERTKTDLNRALRKSVFMNEVYQIRLEQDQDKEVVRYLIDRLDIIAPKATALMQGATDPNDPDQVKIKALIDMLTPEDVQDTNHRRRLHDLADYRNYYRFGIDICDPSDYHRISDLDQRRGKASGGQKFVPFYICLGVAAASAYHNHLGGSRDAPPQSALMLMDEAFEKLDPDNIYKIIQFYQELGLQLIMAAPKTHQALYQETFDTLISIIRVGRGLQATPQHFMPPAHALLRGENPMHRSREFFEGQVRRDRENAAK